MGVRSGVGVLIPSIYHHAAQGPLPLATYLVRIDDIRKTERWDEDEVIRIGYQGGNRFRITVPAPSFHREKALERGPRWAVDFRRAA